MKSKLVAAAGGFATVFVAVISMPVHSEAIHSAVTGSSLCLEVGADGFCLATVSHTVSKQLKENGKKYNEDGSTAVGYSGTAFVPTQVPNCVFDNAVTQGFLFEYVFATAISTRPNGDLVYVELNDTETSSLCVTAEGQYEVTLYRNITGGTGEFAGACGTVDFNGSGGFLPPGATFGTIDGTQVGEIFVGDDCP